MVKRKKLEIERLESIEARIISGETVLIYIGDEVQLKSVGDVIVPKYLSGSWVKVIGFTRQMGVVVARDLEDAGTRRVSPERHVLEVRRVEG